MIVNNSHNRITSTPASSGRVSDHDRDNDERADRAHMRGRDVKGRKEDLPCFPFHFSPVVHLDH
jgi:hypothetical protein